MRVRKIGPGALAWASGFIEGGAVGDVPREVVERYAHRFEILEELPVPRPVADETPVAAKPKPRKRKAKTA